ncbi:uncharacterized protein LOC104266517 [Ciona intestinalis]
MIEINFHDHDQRKLMTSYDSQLSIIQRNDDETFTGLPTEVATHCTCIIRTTPAYKDANMVKFDFIQNDFCNCKRTLLPDINDHILGLLLMILVVLIVLTNSIVMVTVCKILHRSSAQANSRRLKISCIFNFNLSVADIMIGVAAMISLDVQGGRSFSIGTSYNKCLVLITNCTMPCVWSVASMTAICINRYLLIMHPLKYDTYLNWKRALMIVMTIWITACIVGYSPLMGLEYIGRKKIIWKTEAKVMDSFTVTTNRKRESPTFSRRNSNICTITSTSVTNHSIHDGGRCSRVHTESESSLENYIELPGATVSVMSTNSVDEFNTNKNVQCVMLPDLILPPCSDTVSSASGHTQHTQHTKSFISQIRKHSKIHNVVRKTSMADIRALQTIALMISSYVVLWGPFLIVSCVQMNAKALLCLLVVCMLLVDVSESGRRRRRRIIYRRRFIYCRRRIIYYRRYISV